MPRVVPSEIVKYIDHNFPPPVPPHLGRGAAGEFAGLVDLIDQLPDYLLEMDSKTYAQFICSVGTIKWCIAFWMHDRSAQTPMPSPAGTGQSAVSVIRNALVNCKDEAPAPSTSELKFITHQDLRTILRTDISAVNTALSNGEWKAATVLAGSAIEALLLWDLQNRHAAAVPAAVATLVATHVFTNSPSDNLEDTSWSLHHYIEVSSYMRTIKADTAKEARLAKDFRNLIHPGRSQRVGQTCDRGTALTCVGALDHVVRDLS